MQSMQNDNDNGKADCDRKMLAELAGGREKIIVFMHFLSN